MFYTHGVPSTQERNVRVEWYLTYSLEKYENITFIFCIPYLLSTSEELYKNQKQQLTLRILFYFKSYLKVVI